MKKKLAVRVVHYYEEYYCIKYCIYYLFPLLYWPLKKYQGHILGMSTWLAGSYNSVERMAESLTIEKIKQWRKEEYEKKIKDIEHRNELKKKQEPYYSKRIK